MSGKLSIKPKIRLTKTQLRGVYRDNDSVFLFFFSPHSCSIVQAIQRSTLQSNAMPCKYYNEVQLNAMLANNAMQCNSIQFLEK